MGKARDRQDGGQGGDCGEQASRHVAFLALGLGPMFAPSPRPGKRVPEA
jgi:hypothetical protein